MKRNLTLSNRLREVLLNGKWIANTNFKEQILSVDWKVATSKVQNLNTIAALTYHINYYLAGLINAFKTGNLEISDKYSFDMSLIASEEDWENLVNEFLENAKEFAYMVEMIEDNIFDKSFIEEKYGTFQRNIDGVIEHSYYHLGQISLIKKMITQNR